MPIVSCTTRIGGATKSRVLADTQPKIVMNALAKQPFADFTAEQKRYKITLRVTLANGFRNWRFSWLPSRWSRGFSVFQQEKNPEPISTTLADLFTVRARVDPFSAVWASLRWRSGDERHDGVTDGRQAWSRRRSVDSFFPASLV